MDERRHRRWGRFAFAGAALAVVALCAALWLWFAPRGPGAPHGMTEAARRQSEAAARSGTHLAAPLARFYAGLDALEAGTRTQALTILHIGDSHIAADRMTGDLRRLFQARFGNAGRGLMMPGFPFAWYHADGVTFARTGDWVAANSFHRDPGPYGITGVRLTARGVATLSLAMTDGAFDAAEVVLLAQPGGGTATIAAGGTARQVATAADAPKGLRVALDGPAQTLAIKTAGDGPVAVLSVAVTRNRPGVRYINLGIPGATIANPARWDDALVRADLAALRPDLIVSGFGTNDGFDDALDAGRYRRAATAFLDRLHAGAPQADILVLGPPDAERLPKFARGTPAENMGHDCVVLTDTERSGYAALTKGADARLGRWHPPPKLRVVRDTLRDVATQARAGFWDWSLVMGGPCGIHGWATADPPLAFPDHVHFTAAGAKRTADALFAALMDGLAAHRRLVAHDAAGDAVNGAARTAGVAR